MKRTIIVFIIVFCLISFVEFSCLAKETGTAVELWNDVLMSDLIKGVYIRGIEGGFLLSRITTPSEVVIDKLLKDWYSFISQNNETIIRVMNDLYKDPADTYISWSLMCLIACNKLKGEDVEQFLKDVRKIEYQKYQKSKEK